MAYEKNADKGKREVMSTIELSAFYWKLLSRVDAIERVQNEMGYGPVVVRDGKILRPKLSTFKFQDPATGQWRQMYETDKQGNVIFE